MIYTCTWVYKVPITRICSNILLTTILMYLWFHSTIPYLMKCRYPLINRGVILEWQSRVRHGRTRVIQWKIIKIFAKPDFPFKLLGTMLDSLSESYCSSLYTKSFFFSVKYQECHRRVQQFWFWLDPTFCWTWFWSKLFSMVINRRY